MSNFRIEFDALGEVTIPEKEYWGAQTQRAVANFPIGEQKMPKEVLESILYIKQAAAITNMSLKLLDHDIGNKIIEVCETLISMKTYDQFPVSLWSSGSGTQANMNANEVIACMANEILTGKKSGKSPVHPNDHVNMSQSSNDVFPTAMHIAIVKQVYSNLLPSLELLHSALKEKEDAFSDIIKIGRTHMQDAVPLTLGQEFSAYAAQIANAIKRIRGNMSDLHELAQGGTAVGSGLNAHPEFATKVANELRNILGYHFVSAENKFAAIANEDIVIAFSGELNTIASSIMKIANDIRLLGSGPRCGFGELQLPENEPGSSIMPGKVNPTQCESISMVCAQVMGNHVTTTICGTYGFLQLNVFRPCIIHNVLESIRLLSDGSRAFAEECVKGIQANRERINHLVNNSLMLVTCLNSKIGYDKAAKIARYAFDNGLSLKDATLALNVMSEMDFDELVDPRKMI